MIKVAPDRLSPAPSEWRTIHTPGFEVSWAGYCPLNSGFCFGSDDGRILTSDTEGTDQHAAKDALAPSREAINGFAFSGDSIAASTRSEIVIVSGAGDGRTGSRLVIPRGAHGIISMSSGLWVAPLGRGGLLTISPEGRSREPATIHTVGGLPTNFYETVRVPVAGRDIVACAARLGGVIGIELSTPSHVRPVFSLSRQGLDVVDVSALGGGSRAVAAVGRDGTIVLSRNVLSDASPVTVKLPFIQGIAYRLLHTHGDLILLTSKALYALPGLAARFLAGEDVEHRMTAGKCWPMEAVDANLAGNRWLLIVLVDGVVRIDLDQWLPSGATHADLGDPLQAPSPSEAAWETSESYSEETETSFAFA